MNATIKMSVAKWEEIKNNFPNVETRWRKAEPWWIQVITDHETRERIWNMVDVKPEFN